jgi:excisionase family DNA binding protein
MRMVDDDREESFLTVAEVAEWLKLNQQTVRNWIDQGSLPAVRVGRRVRIKRSDLERVLDQGYQPGNPPPVDESGPSAEDFWSGEPVGAAEFSVAPASGGGGADAEDDE